MLMKVLPKAETDFLQTQEGERTVLVCYMARSGFATCSKARFPVSLISNQQKMDLASLISDVKVIHCCLRPIQCGSETLAPMHP